MTPGWTALLGVLLLAGAATAAEDYPRGLLTVPEGGDDDGEARVRRFVSQHMEPRHAVAIGVVARGSKSHKLLEALAVDDSLWFLLAVGVLFGPEARTLTMHRHRYPPEAYGGRWTVGALKVWLKDTSFAPVNRMQYQFAPPKYLTAAPFGTVLVVKPLTEQTEALVQSLESWAKRYTDTLKFTFFTKAAGTQKLCDTYGIWSNDELLLLEQPLEARAKRSHSHLPPSPKYRMEVVTPERVDEFFREYAAGTWPRYYKAAVPRTLPTIVRGIRELTGWDFEETVTDPYSAVLVEFVSANCDSCTEFASTFQQVARLVQDSRRKAYSPLANLTVARIDQSANEHSQLIKGTPWLRYWPTGSRKRVMDVEMRSAESILDFLEERAAEEAEGAERARVRAAKAAKAQPSAAPAKDSADADGSCGAGDSGGCAAPGGESPAGAGEAVPLQGSEVRPRVVLPRPDPGAARGYLSTEVDPGDVDEQMEASSGFVPEVV